MSRIEELTEQTNRELREILEDYDLPTEGNKAELVDRIVRFETGLPEPEADASAEEPEEDAEGAATEADVADTPPEPVLEVAEGTDEDVESEGGSSDEVLIKYTGTSSLYQEGRHTFSVNHPYAVVSAEMADKLVQRQGSRFRPATQGEVERYYS